MVASRRSQALFRKNTAKYDSVPANAATKAPPDPVSDAPTDAVPVDSPPPLFEPTTESFVEERAMKKAIAIVAKGPGYLRRGAQAMQQVFVTTTKMHDAIVSDLRALHPPSNERPPAMPVVPDFKVSSVSEEDLLAALRSMATGAAAGPNGITVELLLLLASDDVCRKALCLMVRDIINYDIPEEIRKRLTRCRLVALAKECGGTRPIAIGDALLKVAGKILFMRHKEEINKYFGDLQFGCLSSGGCETVAHNVRADVEGGRCVLTVDFSNAFNSPARKAIGEALHGVNTFQSFWPIFALEYGTPSELLYFANKRHHTTLMSETGTRQGSSLGGFYFCLVMHPILCAMKDRFPDIRIYAYIDDVTLTGNAADLVAAFEFLRRECIKIDLVLNEKKCEWFGGINAVPIPTDLLYFYPVCPVKKDGSLDKKAERRSVKEVEGCIKVLGAFIGLPGAVREKLQAKLEKHRVFFDRLRASRVDSRTFTMLVDCGLPRHVYHMRTHSAGDTEALTAHFDVMTRQILMQWFDMCDDDVDGWDFIGLPVRLGGCGAVVSSSIRECAYIASKFKGLRALPHHKHGLPPGGCVSQDLATAIIYSTKRVEMSRRGPKFARRLELNSMKGSAAYLRAVTKKQMPSESFASVTRLRCGAKSASIPPTLTCTCPTCNGREWEQREWVEHVHGLAALPGANATTRHDGVTRLVIHDTVVEARVEAEWEPEALQQYRCKKCYARDVSPKDAVSHSLACGIDVAALKRNRSGPDNMILWKGVNRQYYDFTVINALCPSNLRVGLDTLVKSVTREKHVKYVQSKKVPEGRFTVVACFSSGGMTDETRGLLADCAEVAKRNVLDVIEQFSVQLQTGNARIIAQALHGSLRAPA